MAHARTNIRQAFINRLKDRTAAGSNVFDSMLYNMVPQMLPAINVFSNSEEVLTATIGFPRHQIRTVRITVECYAKATTSVNMIIDNLAASVENVILSDPTLGGICKDCRLESTEIRLNSDGDGPASVASLLFTVLYSTKEDDPANNI